MYNKLSGKKELLDAIKGGLIVSCQARVGWPMFGKEIMAAFAKAAEIGGAVGIRANWPENIAEIRRKVNLPIIGLNKIWNEGYDVYITPTFKSAVDIIKAGCDIVAIDGTNRKRPENESFDEIVYNIRRDFPHILIMADISNFEEGLNAINLGVDLVSTTLSGYTEYTKKVEGADFELIRQLSNLASVPVVAEGKIHTPEEAVKALHCGAHAVVVGTAITRPEVITRWFSEKIRAEFKI